MLAGVQVVNGYDPVGQLAFSSLMHQSTHGRLYPDVIDIVGTSAPAPFADACWLDAFRATAVLTDADPEVGRPTAVNAEPAHLQIAAGKRQVEPPRPQLLRVDHFLVLEPGMPHLQPGHRCRGACPPKREPAALQPEVAADGSAIAV